MRGIFDDPDPTPEPPTEWPNLLPRLNAERAKYGEEMTADECVKMLNDAMKAEGNGWGLLKKEGGNHGKQPGTGQGCSVDWVLNKYLMKGTDCLIDAGNSTYNDPGVSTPTWPPHGEEWDEGFEFVEPV